MTYDLILRGGHVTDPVNGRDAISDVAFEGGRVAGVAPSVSGASRAEIDCRGLHVLPGLIDSHVHISGWLGGAEGHRMLAKAGITTALDVAGPVDTVMDYAVRKGTGLTIGCIEYVRSGHTVDTPDPHKAELRDHLARARALGAVGLKILGGHFPLTPEASARVIEVCAEEGAHVAFHAGTLRAGQGMEAMHEALELAGSHPMQLPHVNSYIRGTTGSVIDETIEACNLLEARPNIWSESYLAPFNGVSAKCSNGVPESVACHRGLARKGYEANVNGLERAILDGWAWVHAPVDGENVLLAGAEGLSAWRAAETDLGCSFFINPPEARINLVMMRRKDNSFAIDALATDGGGIPRNDICERGLALVLMNGLTLGEFVHKASAEPARMMGLSHRKGQLGVGADADVTVVDLQARKPVMSFGSGRPILMRGEVVGSGTTVLAPEESRLRVEGMGLGFIPSAPFSFSAVQARFNAGS